MAQPLQDGALFNEYADLISLDLEQPLRDTCDLAELFEGLLDLPSFNRKLSPVKSGRWFSWQGACAEQVREFFSMRLLLRHKYPQCNPDSNTKSFAQLRSDLGGLRLATQCCAWSVWYGVQVLRVGSKPCWDSYTKLVEGIKSPQQGLRRIIAMTTADAWMRCEELLGLVGVFSQTDEYQRVLQYHTLAKRHLDDSEHQEALEIYVNQVWFYGLSVLSKRSLSLSKFATPPECYSAILGQDPEAAREGVQLLLADFHLFNLAEQALAAQELVNDLRYSMSSPVRLACTCFEAGNEAAGRSLLAGLLITMPDSKFIEDLHQQVKTDALANSNRRQSSLQIQQVITNSMMFEGRGVPHPASLDKASFLRRWRRTSIKMLKHGFSPSREKLPPWYSKMMGVKTWPSLSEGSLGRSAAAWQWMHLFHAKNLKQKQVRLEEPILLFHHCFSLHCKHECLTMLFQFLCHTLWRLSFRDP